MSEEPEPEGYAEWKKELAAAELKGIKARIENAPPIGMLPNGELNLISPPSLGKYWARDGRLTMKYSNMTDQEIYNALLEIFNKKVPTARKFINDMANGTYRLSKDPASRAQVIGSHQKLLQEMLKEADDLYNALCDPRRVQK
jgi:hypothetical protein